VFNIVDELATIPNRIPGPFEGNVDDGKPTIMSRYGIKHFK
jgi:hypothetical protein